MRADLHELKTLQDRLQLGDVLRVGGKEVPVLPDELHAVIDKHQRHLGKLCLFVRHEEVVVECVAELLQDGFEDAVVQREVAVGVAENEPAGQRSVRSAQLSLHTTVIRKGGVLRYFCSSRELTR